MPNAIILPCVKQFSACAGWQKLAEIGYIDLKKLRKN
jgi:hypothetical protein